MPLSNEPTMPHSHLQIFPSKPIKKYQRNGIALLITLVILALLSIFMTEFAFETTLETRGIRNFQASFKARNAVKSMFKAVLVGLEEQDEVTFFRKYIDENILKKTCIEYTLLNPCSPQELGSGLLSDFPDVVFFTPYIRPIDHLFDINRISDSSTYIEKNYDLNEIINILQRVPVGTDGDLNATIPQSYLDNFEILVAYGSFKDWVDKNNDRYLLPTGELIGSEQIDYLNNSMDIKVNNSKFNNIFEIKLLNGVGNNKLLFEKMNSSIGGLMPSIRKYITIHPVWGEFNKKQFNDDRCLHFKRSRININLATAEDVIEFLNIYNASSLVNVNCPNKRKVYAELSNDIGQILIEGRDQRSPPRFNNISQLNSLLNTPILQGLVLSPKEFFILYSSWYEIHLKTEIDNVQAELKAVVSLKRETNGNVKPNSIVIHDFLLR